MLFTFKIGIKTAIKPYFFIVFGVVFIVSGFLNFLRVLVILFYHINIHQNYTSVTNN